MYLLTSYFRWLELSPHFYNAVVRETPTLINTYRIELVDFFYNWAAWFWCLELSSLVITLRELTHFHMNCCFMYALGWEFAHRFSEQIARFLPKNERMSDSLKKISDSLISSFLVSDLSESLMVAHFWWATWVICSRSLICGERPERFTLIAHQKRRNERFAHFLNKNRI